MSRPPLNLDEVLRRRRYGVDPPPHRHVRPPNSLGVQPPVLLRGTAALRDPHVAGSRRGTPSSPRVLADGRVGHGSGLRATPCRPVACRLVRRHLPGAGGVVDSQEEAGPDAIASVPPRRNARRLRQAQDGQARLMTVRAARAATSSASDERAACAIAQTLVPSTGPAVVAAAAATRSSVRASDEDDAGDALPRRAARRARSDTARRLAAGPSLVVEVESHSASKSTRSIRRRPRERRRPGTRPGRRRE